MRLFLATALGFLFAAAVWGAASERFGGVTVMSRWTFLVLTALLLGIVIWAGLTWIGVPNTIWFLQGPL